MTRYTDYINFTIHNDVNASNPVNIYKRIINIDESTGLVTEPECTEQDGVWTPDSVVGGTGTCDFNTGAGDNNNLSGWIWYDLYVRVYDANKKLIWWQAIYVDADEKSIDDVYGNNREVLLGMIPAGGYMEVTQSYHLSPLTTNWAQGDIMTFDIKVRADQISGTAVLENKTAGPEYKLILDDDITGTLTYEVKNPTFDFSFTGKVTQSNASYTLLHAVDPWPQTGSVVLGTTVSDGNGNVDFSGDIELNQDMKDAKVWLILSSDWNGTNMIGWYQADYLLETGLIWYEDTDL